MPIGIGGVAFEGPYSRHEMLGRRPGVFAVLDGRTLPPLHAEKTDDVRRTVEDHARWSRWQEACDSPTFAVFYTSVDRNQRRVERAVREEFDLYEDEHAPAARTNGRPVPEENGGPARLRDAGELENGRPAARTDGRPDEPGRDAGDAGEASAGEVADEERREPAARERRSFHFHVPADPVDHRRARVS